MKKMRITIQVSDDFEKGMCYFCPLADDNDTCGLTYKYYDCPLKEDNTITFVPCKCGYSNRETWHMYGGGIRIKCRKCGYEAIGKSYNEAKRKWVEGVLNDE